jgi:Ca2+/H+ antiporter
VVETEEHASPPSGVIIALLVLLPETIAAVRAAARDRIQTSLNLALGSAMASIGLTVPAIAIAMIRLPGPLLLGLGGTQTVLLALTFVVGTLTVVPSRANVLPGGVHLGLLAVFLPPGGQPLGQRHDVVARWVVPTATPVEAGPGPS